MFKAKFIQLQNGNIQIPIVKKSEIAKLKLLDQYSKYLVKVYFALRAICELGAFKLKLDMKLRGMALHGGLQSENEEV